MFLVQKGESKKLQNGDTCTAFEYPMDDREINGAVVEISGRYPEFGQVKNAMCRELVFILAGEGEVTVEGEISHVVSGDLVLILPNEPYFWEGKLSLFIASTPAWSPEQHTRL